MSMIFLIMNFILVPGYTFCQRLDECEYHFSAKKTTKEELVSLLKTIDEDSSLSTKERKKLLDQFYTSNPTLFLEYFGERDVPMCNGRLDF